MGEVITLSNHSPFKLASSYSTLDLTSYVTDPETGEVTGTDYLSSSSVGEYIKSANYADQALGEFLDYINNSDYFNNTVFVFYGDHDAKLSRSEINYLYNLNPNTGNLYTEGDENYVNYDYYAHELNKKTPLIIWTKNSKLKNVFTGTVEYYTGMYNVAPTILNMFGLYNKYSVGEDIFSVKNDNFIVFPSGNILNNKIYYNNSTDEYKNLTDEEMDMDYIMNLLELGEKRLEVSNSIIVYNLLKDEQIDGE
jgi:phosphoglycerol transferase MdoB-like AlkP superfamily enzyme